ncbi:hypothetical protein EVAR_52881_1 [Eumeta japonica]|uniref:Uncharacterized protein n=1 Tax=Eumeta variegata TaxID=151549 RepID=A0A4C1YNB5_EUMVA|nr:hypothetical protein EVAR_52881_1 [Eumeta japonica]
MPSSALAVNPGPARPRPGIESPPEILSRNMQTVHSPTTKAPLFLAGAAAAFGARPEWTAQAAAFGRRCATASSSYGVFSKYRKYSARCHESDINGTLREWFRFAAASAAADSGATSNMSARRVMRGHCGPHLATPVFDAAKGGRPSRVITLAPGRARHHVCRLIV